MLKDSTEIRNRTRSFLRVRPSTQDGGEHSSVYVRARRKTAHVTRESISEVKFT
jgi:hypothetical protein